MKLLLVFLSALMLVARGDVAPAVEEDGVYEVKPELVAGYAVAAGQEAEGAAPQWTFAERAPGVGAFGAEEAPSAYEAAERAAEGARVPESGVDIPRVASFSWTCKDSGCNRSCRRRGYKSGRCHFLKCRCYR